MKLTPDRDISWSAADYVAVGVRTPDAPGAPTRHGVWLRGAFLGLATVWRTLCVFAPKTTKPTRGQVFPWVGAEFLAFGGVHPRRPALPGGAASGMATQGRELWRSEEHTSELQSREN